MNLTRDDAYLPAGLELDSLIAENLLRWKVTSESEVIGASLRKMPASWAMPPDADGEVILDRKPAPYSSDIAYAWPLLKHLDKWMVESNLRNGVTAVVRMQHWSDWGQADAPTAELAICRAIILALVAEAAGQDIEPVILGR
jgi:hypothetical protein